MVNVREAVVKQFGRPSGLFGRLAGAVMARRPSNRARNTWTVDLLAIHPDDLVLEIGYGPGLSIAHAAGLASRGHVVGVDHSPVMLRQASRRNAAAIAAGRVELRRGTVADLAAPAETAAGAPIRTPAGFDKVFAVNVFMFWPDPVAVLRQVGELMRPGGVIALTLQPRDKGATAADARRAGDRMATALRDAGFVVDRVETLPLAPVDAACALARKP
jgi:SAM-dependent methyltransferase